MNARAAGKGKMVRDRDKMRSEEIRFLIQQKISYINSTVSVSMLWWVSSIALCGYVLDKVWSNQGKLHPPSFVFGLGFVLFVFFFFITYFGILLARRSDIVQEEVAKLVDQLECAHKLEGIKGKFFQSEIVSFQISMRMGAFSFALVFAVWDFCWFLLLYFKSPSPSPSPYWAVGCVIWNLAWLALWTKRRYFLRWRCVRKILQMGEDIPEAIILSDSEMGYFSTAPRSVHRFGKASNEEPNTDEIKQTTAGASPSS